MDNNLLEQILRPIIIAIHYPLGDDPFIQIYGQYILLQPDAWLNNRNLPLVTVLRASNMRNILRFVTGDHDSPTLVRFLNRIGAAQQANPQYIHQFIGPPQLARFTLREMLTEHTMQARQHIWLDLDRINWFLLRVLPQTQLPNDMTREMLDHFIMRASMDRTVFHDLSTQLRRLPPAEYNQYPGYIYMQRQIARYVPPPLFAAVPDYLNAHPEIPLDGLFWGTYYTFASALLANMWVVPWIWALFI